MSETTINVARPANTYNLYQNSAEDAGKKLRSFFYSRGVKLKPGINSTQNKEELIGANQDKSKRQIKVELLEVTPQTASLASETKERQQTENLYYSSILPQVEEVFSCRNNGDLYEVPLIGVMHVLETSMNIDEVINFLYNDPDMIPKIIEEGGFLEFNKIIDLLLDKIKYTTITTLQSCKVFSVLNKLYKKLPEVNDIQPSLYGKMHAFFSLLINDNKRDIMHTLIEAMTSDHNNKYFDLYINDDGTIENNYLDLIVKIYSSTTKSQEDDCSLFENLFSFLVANDLNVTKITSAKALHLACSISDIISTFNEDHQATFIEYFLDRKIDGNKFDDLLVQTLKQNGLLEKYHCVIHKKKDISKIQPCNVIDYLRHQDQVKVLSKKVDDAWLFDSSISTKEQLLAMIHNLDIYNCHTLANYLSSTDDIVFQEVIASKSSQAYEHMIDLLTTKLQNATTINKEDANKIASLLNKLYIKLPSLGIKSQSLCSKIYKAFNLLIPQSINLIVTALQQATHSNPDFYCPLSVVENKKIIDSFLELIAKIYESPADDYELLGELLENIKINISQNNTDYEVLFITEKLYKIIINLQDEKRSMMIKSLLDDPKIFIDIKNYLYILLDNENINIPECNLQPLDKSSMKVIKERMDLIKIRDSYFFD